MNRIFTKSAKFNALSRHEQRTLLAAMAWLPLFWLGLHILGLRRFQTLLLHSQPDGACCPVRNVLCWVRLVISLKHRKNDRDGVATPVPLGTPTQSDLPQNEIVGLANLVNIAARQPFIPATCLTRSLLLNWMLQQRGIASQLRIGVRLSQGQLDAHAWVEYAGIPINDQADVADHFAPFAEVLPPDAFPSP